MTDRESRSLGAAAYQRELAITRLTLIGKYDDERRNHYCHAVKEAGAVTLDPQL